MQVRPLRAFLAVVMVLLWMTGGSHCEVSAACGSLVSAEHSHDGASEPCPTSHDSGCDDCSLCLTIEGGLVPLTYKTAAPTAPLPAAFFVPLVPAGLTPAAKTAVETPPPPEQATRQNWQFVQRVALPVRAPSLAS